MDFGGKYLFAADRLAVWEALNNTDVLKQALPGCQRIEWTAKTTLELEIAVNLGLMKPVFAGELELSRIVPAESYMLSGRGKGGVMGLAHGAAEITLQDAAAGTLLAFTAQGGASGQIMKLGRKLVGNSAQKVIDHFFERIGGAMQTRVIPLDDEGLPQDK